MSKTRLSNNQLRRVSAKHKQRLAQSEAHDSSSDASDDTLFMSPQSGLVISRFGKLADVESHQGEIYRCNIRRTLPALVTGDRVVWRPSKDKQTYGVIEGLHDRRSELVRPDFYDGVKLVAANIDQIIIVTSILPELSLNIIDRYLVACEATQICPILVINKIDLCTPEQRNTIGQQVELYRQLGYFVFMLSCLTGEGIAEFKQALHHKISIFVGQSGVGKSSMINYLHPMPIRVSVGDVSENSGLGQHTTTATTLYHLIDGGDIIDSPGIREFGLWHLEPAQILQGFREFHAFLGGCQFRDCDHLTTPGCALQTAVNEHHISASRLENYHRILQSIREVKARTNKTYR